ncbi:hypothetical protein [Embleya sp. NPDC059259]|uniref:hypothetical protein n=1 Tax=unclassified Embleya TaxID=2699296 RepID=UPI00367805D5
MADQSRGVTAAKVDPSRLMALLEDIGWHLAGSRRGIYKRYVPPSDRPHGWGSSSLLIPLDETAPEYIEIMTAALAQLSLDRDVWQRSIYPRLAVEASDEFRFRRESAAPSGLIDWRSGERLIEASRRALVAGAKYYLSPDRHYVNKHGRFASRYLDNVLMGQTSPGSYIVTAYAPPQVSVPVGSRSDAGLGFEVDATTMRMVSRAVMEAVEATAEAVDHYRTSGTMSGFESGVIKGISYEMTSALLAITAMSDGADIAVEWDPVVPFSGSPSVAYEFQGSDAEVLSRAATQLADDDSSEKITFIGRVHLLAKKQAGAPGVFGLEALSNQSPHKVRVRLEDEDDYHEAVRAHEEDLALQVTGTLEKEGNLNWLYHAAVVQTFGPISELKAKIARKQEVRGQMDLFEEDR